MPSNSSSPRLPEIKDKLKRPASSPPNSDPSKIYKASAEYNGKVQSHHPRYEEPQEHNSLWSGSESSTRFDAGSSTSSGRSQHTNAPPNRVLHCPQDPRRALINKYAAQSGYQHNQPTSSGLPPTGNSSNPAPLMRGSSSGYGNSLNPNLVPPTTANSVMSGYGNRPQPVPPPSNINAAAISRLEPGPGSRFDHSNNYGNQTESRNVTLDQGYPSTSHSAESTCQRTPEETEFKQSLVKAKSDLVHAWAKWFSGTERHPRYNDIWNGFCSQR